MELAAQSSKPPLGTSGDWRRRLLFHYAPLALASALLLVLFMGVSSFDANKYPFSDLFTGSFPKDFPEGQAGEAQDQGQPHEIPPERLEQIPEEHRANIPGQEGSDNASRTAGGGGSFFGLSVRRLTVGTGYLATALLGLTLLIGPANLLLRRRNPVSSYLTRDVGLWAAGFSVVHVFFGLEVHTKITDPIPMFIMDGEPLTNSFGLANWTGLAATLIVVGLLAISSDFALSKLKARTWKNIQRLNYALFALVAVHAFFYGALLRTDSPYTLVLVISVIVVIVGQSVGVWLWRRRQAQRGATLAQQPG